MQREADYYEKQSEATATFLSIMGTVIAVFVSMGAMIGATITMNAQVANRQREIGTLRGSSPTFAECQVVGASAIATEAQNATNGLSIAPRMH